MPIIFALIGLAVNSSLCRLIPIGSIHHGTHARFREQARDRIDLDEFATPGQLAL